MAALGDRPQMEFRGLMRRGGVKGAVLVLSGAKLAELRRACALAASLTDRCLLVAVDGGLKTCLAGRRRPDLFVGDVDSCKQPPSEIPTVIYPRDKDFSDLAGALDELRRHKVQTVAVAGLLGGRLDHEWANLQELGARSASFAGILAPTERGTVLVTRRGCRARTVVGREGALDDVEDARGGRGSHSVPEREVPGEPRHDPAIKAFIQSELEQGRSTRHLPAEHGQ